MLETNSSLPAYLLHVLQCIICNCMHTVHVTCRAEGSGNDVVVTCTRVGNSQQITSIRYSINGGTTMTGER